MSVLEYSSTSDVQRRWRATEHDMQDTRRRLDRTDVSGLPARTQNVAQLFLTAWAGYAGESARMADGYVRALGATDVVLRSTDVAAGGDFRDLDGRLGPER